MGNLWSRIGLVLALVAGGVAVGVSSQFAVSAVKSSGERAVFVPITPCRLLDTRPGSDNVGPRSTPIGAGESYTVEGRSPSGNCGAGVIPADATALTLNVTAVGATQQTNLRFYPAGATLPTVSNLNPSPGAAPTPNAVTTDLDAAGQFVVFNFAGSVHVIIDVAGYFIDHNHDDRYYTKQQVDDAIARGPAVQIASAFSMFPVDDMSNWTRTVGWVHAASGSVECILFPLETAPGQRVTEMRVTYLNSTALAVQVEAQVAGFRVTAGPLPGGLGDLGHSALDSTQSLPPSGPGTSLPEMIAPPGPDNVVRDGFEYFGAVCTDEPLGVIGAQVTLADS
ncbi:MAG: hypothetical protein AAFY28_01515 [Actinomycetota bacterium]